MRDAFVAVPEVTLPNGVVVPSFKVGQYVATRGQGGRATVTAKGAPWVRVNYRAARAACEAAGYQLITEFQWLAIAWNAAQQDCNWTKGKVGKGKLFRGLRHGNVSCAMPGDYESPDENERRWLTLSNGESICDLGGNLWQWVFDDVQGDTQGLTGVLKVKSPSLSVAPFPSEKKGVGYRPGGACDWSGGALVRGGSWASERNVGAFCLGLDQPDYENSGVGFRCTAQ